MDDLIAEFLTETAESMAELDQDIVRLEQNPNDSELLGKIFRLVHTVKGTCGFLGLPRLEAVAHAAENVFGRYRDGELDVTAQSVTLILESMDRIKALLGNIEQNGGEGEGDDSALIAKLDAVYKGESKPALPAAVSESRDVSVEDAKDDPAQGKESALAAKTLRVNVDVIENLMTMVSELVLTRNQLLQILRSQKESHFTTPLQRLNLVVSDLQEGVMQTRMQPIGNAWSKLPRIIRDLSVELGKKIELEMRGQDTELDRQVLEMIKDPLTHMVRNSADHGIEMPQERLAGGKSETGHVLLNAYHEGGHILIEISDDGKGLNTDKIRKKIVANGLATEADLAGMTDAQVQQYIFRAGFSTAEKVTAVSGRGVGMDVVRTNIEKIGGTIELKSVFGKGSTFTIKIPLTLAIVSALIVEAGKERFAIPQLSVRELVRIGGEYRIEHIKGTPVLRLRDRLLPLVALSGLLQLDDGKVKGGYIVVLQVGGYSFGIIVDRVFDTEEIVVKPVAPILRGLNLFSGNTILGDGSVIMILDPNGIAAATGEVSGVSGNAGFDLAENDAAGRGVEKTALLVFRAGAGAPKAVPLSLVARLEDIDLADVEYSNNQHVVQYRGQLMPLVPFDGAISMKGDGHRHVLVFSDDNSSMGLVVDAVMDIVEEAVDIQLSGGSQGLLGSAIIGGKATDVIDVGHFLSHGHGDWFNANENMPFGRENGVKKVLLVDDSPFFRNMLKPLLDVAGYEVTVCENADDAFRHHEKGVAFDLIISDIEMPGANGFEFAQAVRASESWKKTPLIALTSHTTQEDMDRGRRVGFDGYIPKSDRDALLDAISKTLLRGNGGVAA